MKMYVCMHVYVYLFVCKGKLLYPFDCIRVSETACKEAVRTAKEQARVEAGACARMRSESPRVPVSIGGSRAPGKGAGGLAFRRGA